jgi:hypothetical protein
MIFTAYFLFPVIGSMTLCFKRFQGMGLQPDQLGDWQSLTDSETGSLGAGPQQGHHNYTSEPSCGKPGFIFNDDCGQTQMQNWSSNLKDAVAKNSSFCFMALLPRFAG